MGPSGSGKSTLLTLAGGLDQPTRRDGVASRASTSASLGNNGPGADAAYLDRLRLPGLQPDPGAHRGRERRPARASSTASVPGPPARLAPAALEEVGIGDLADRFPDDDVGRPAAAGRHRARHRGRPPADPRRRADRRPRHRHRARRSCGCCAPAATPAPPGCSSPTRPGTRPGPTGSSSCATGSWSTRSGADPVDVAARSAGAARRTVACRGWRPSLRLARRDALRSRGRSLLVLVMIALPVLAVTRGRRVVQTTADVGGIEGARPAARRRRRAGPLQPGVSGLSSPPTPTTSTAPAGAATEGVDAGLAVVRRRHGASSATSGRRRCASGWTEIRCGDKRRRASTPREVDLADPLAAGLFDDHRRTGRRRRPTRPWSTTRSPSAGLGRRRHRWTARVPRRSTVVGVGESAPPSATPPRSTCCRHRLGAGLRRLRPRTSTWLVDGGAVLVGTRCRELNRGRRARALARRARWTRRPSTEIRPSSRASTSGTATPRSRSSPWSSSWRCSRWCCWPGRRSPSAPAARRAPWP